MMPRHWRCSHRLNNNNARQKQTEKLVNLAILNNIPNTVNLNDETAR